VEREACYQFRKNKHPNLRSNLWILTIPQNKQNLELDAENG